MKKQLMIFAFAALFLAEIVTLSVFAAQSPDLTQDAVAVNEIVRSVEENWGSVQSDNMAYDYAVLNSDGELVYASRGGLSESLNSAIIHRDTVVDVVVGGAAVGKVIIYNDSARGFFAQKQIAVCVLAVAIAVQCAICVWYALYLNRAVLKPFARLRGFAERVACGNLDVPLEMDKHNLFGAFTESFDIMRSELKAARESEAQAQESKKELVAKLSHDIKTPVASIKAVAEVGKEVTTRDADKTNYTQIIDKADQINELINNLFTATIEELHQLSVTPTDMESAELNTIIQNADYLRRAIVPAVPSVLLYADKLRLQQVFDNVFSNSYKYANTDIVVGVELSEGMVLVRVEDFGGGVANEELALIKNKYSRGANAKGIGGAGLGLFISDCFMRGMGGELMIENGENGLIVTVAIALSGAQTNPKN